MKIGIYGGTFNPPHLGHVRSAETATKQLGLERLIVVPSGIPPHKALPDGTPGADVRLHMTREAFGGIANAVVSDIEAASEKACYTVDTVAAIRAEHPGAELYLLMGTDMFLTLEDWKGSASLLGMVTPVAFSRGEGDERRIRTHAQRIRSSRGVHTETVTGSVTEISSSRLRELLPLRGGTGYIKDTIYEYIIRNRLYGAKPDFDWLRARAHELLRPERISHVLGCEEEAVRLANRWGANADDAREAGILHDITKKLSVDEHLALCKQYGVDPAITVQSDEKLLHAKTGAALARALFGVSDEVYGAILWHTTGRAGMTKLEKIIYLADYIEPNRVLDGVDRLRKLAYTDLDAAVVAGLEMSAEDMLSRGITPNKTTYGAISDLRGQQQKQKGFKV